MRVAKSRNDRMQEGDMTPMIDMTFQLIAFFMVLLNFSEGEQHEGIILPTAQLAIPAEGPMDAPIILHMERSGRIRISGVDIDIQGLKPHLINEANSLVARDKSPSDATIIIRADRNVETGKVQDVIRICQENRFDRFVLRVKEEVGH